MGRFPGVSFSALSPEDKQKGTPGDHIETSCVPCSLGNTVHVCSEHA